MASVPVRIFGNATVGGAQIPVAYMCYAESKTLANWTVTDVEKCMNNAVGSAKQVIMIIHPTGATDSATDPRIINKLYPNNLYLGIWIRSPDFQRAFNEFKKTFGKRVDMVEQDGFADELKQLLNAKGVTFPSGLIDEIAKQVRRNA